MNKQNLAISSKKDAILRILNELDAKHENILKLYFGLGEESVCSVDEIVKKLKMSKVEVIKLKDDAIRNFIKLIVLTGIFKEIDKNISDKFIKSSNSNFLDKFMIKFIN